MTLTVNLALNYEAQTQDYTKVDRNDSILHST